MEKLIGLLMFIQSMSNVDKDGDTFFCVETDFQELIQQAIELAQELRVTQKLYKERIEHPTAKELKEDIKQLKLKQSKIEGN